MDKVPKHGHSVFSCFACGGGSSMGYKLSGYDVIGCCEIDPRVNAVYRENLHPRYNFICDVRDLKNASLPEDLYHLDILDGSPPCSVFSMIGKREAGWGIEKAFREGQKIQRLDDLFFQFITVAKKLQPKIVVAENVKGLLLGNAKGYVHEIFKAFNAAGYESQLFLLNSKYMGVPQERERSIFIARRKDLSLPKISLSYHESPILFGEVRAKHGVSARGKDAQLLEKMQPGDKYVSWIEAREKNKKRLNFRHIVSDSEVCPTIVSSSSIYREIDRKAFCESDFARVQSFPMDYDFGDQSAQYICGMSVPPIMMAQISRDIYLQWLRKRGETQCQEPADPK